MHGRLLPPLTREPPKLVNSLRGTPLRSPSLSEGGLRIFAVCEFTLHQTNTALNAPLFFAKCLFFFFNHFCMFPSLSGKIFSHLQKAFGFFFSHFLAFLRGGLVIIVTHKKSASAHISISNRTRIHSSTSPASAGRLCLHAHCLPKKTQRDPAALIY